MQTIKMKRYFKKAGLLFLGLILILFGLISMPLPVIPGFIFVIMGVLVVSLEYPTLEAWLEDLSTKHVSLGKEYRKAREKIKHWLGY